MKRYINMKIDGEVETVDEFTTNKEAQEMVREYNKSDSYNQYYVSIRCTRDWGNK